jgi:hypothetical protein
MKFLFSIMAAILNGEWGLTDTILKTWNIFCDHLSNTKKIYLFYSSTRGIYRQGRGDRQPLNQFRALFRHTSNKTMRKEKRFMTKNL